MGWVIVVLGCLVGGAGVYEVSADRRLVRRPGSSRTTPRIDGLSLTFVGGVVLLLGLLAVTDYPLWLTILVGLCAVAGAVWLLVTWRSQHEYRPSLRPTEPPSDPSEVYRRPPRD